MVLTPDVTNVNGDVLPPGLAIKPAGEAMDEGPEKALEAEDEGRDDREGDESAKSAKGAERLAPVSKDGSSPASSAGGGVGGAGVRPG